MAETAVAPLYKFSSDFGSAGLQSAYAASSSSSATLAAGSLEESKRASSTLSDSGVSDPALLEKKRKNASAQGTSQVLRYFVIRSELTLFSPHSCFPTTSIELYCQP